MRISCNTSIPLFLALAVVVCGSPAGAHEFWLVPQTFRPSPGDSVALRLFVGDGLGAGEPYPRNPFHIDRFFARGAAQGDVAGRAGADPAGSILVRGSGNIAVGYSSRRRSSS